MTGRSLGEWVILRHKYPRANDQYVIDCHLDSSQAGPTLEALSCLLWKVEQQQIVAVYNFPQDQYQVDTFFTTVYSQ